MQNEELIQAAQDGELPFVIDLLRSGANVNVKNQGGLTPLHEACCNHHVEMVRELLDNWDVDIDTKNNAGWTPLLYACYNGPWEIVQLLLSAGADIRAVNDDGYLPIHEAVLGREWNVVMVLMKKLYASIFEHEGRLPLHALLEDAYLDGTSLRDAFEQDVPDTEGVLDVMTFLVGQNLGSLSACNQDGELPLHVACATSTPVEIVRFLIEQAPESILVPRTTDGAYPLHVALERGASSDSDVIKMLLEHHDPVTITLRNNAGETPLHLACRCGVPFEIAESLVDHYKASVQAVTPQGDLPLFLACATVLPSLDVIYLLLKLYPNVVYP
jgi:ankyrin repeat protein